MLPAKDSVPCRRDQLPAFMQRLVELYQDEDHDAHPTARVSSSIEVRGTTIWTGYIVAYVDRKDRELHERIWYDAEGNERHDPKPKKQKRTARLSTGGKAPRKLLATRASRST